MAKPKATRGQIREQKRADIKAAMPDVQELVAKHGAKIIAACLHRLTRYGPELHRMELLRRELARLERQVT